MADPAQREDHLRGVVDIGVVVVVELERPAARGELGPAHRPVARPGDFLVEHPVRRFHERRVIGAHSGVGERDGGETGVPDRGLAGLDHAGAVLAPDREPVQRGESGPHHRVVEVVAQQMQRDDGVDGGRLDPAPAAVVLLAFDDPAGGRVHGETADSARGDPVIEVQRLVEALEDTVPTGRRSRGPGRVRFARVGVQLVQREGGGPDRPLRGDDRERHDGLAGPAAEVVDIERDPLGEEHQLGRELRQVVPFPPAEQGQPDPGEHPARRDSALFPDPPRGTDHVRVLRPVTGQPQCHVRLDGGGEVPGAAVERGPGAVTELLAADEAAGRLDRGGILDSEELAEQEVLGVHGDVGGEVALPPALLVLLAEEMLHRAFRGPPRGGQYVVRGGG